jgi:hypothetical protein
VLRSDGFLDFLQRPKNQIIIIKSTTFRKLVLLPSSGEKRGKGGTPTLLGPLDRASQQLADVRCPVIVH